MLFKIAWKNIWRSKVRSFVVITAIALGLVAGVFASAFVNGMMKQRVDSVIKTEMSHFQIHNPQYRDEMLASQFIENGEDIVKDIQSDERVVVTSGRVLSNTMIASANFSGAIRAVGIDPENEAATTGLDQRLIEGEYFEGMKSNPVFVSKVTAEKYKLKLRSKVVLTMQDIHGDMVAGAFRVVGIFDSKNGMVDKMNVFVRKTDLKKLMKLEGGELHEIAVYLQNHELAETTAIDYQKKYADLDVLPWMDLSTGMRLMIDIMDLYTIILVGIILLALLFSIVNTMLMAVLERVRELGMLMAIGMTKQKVFSMIMLETVFLSLVGGPVGLMVSWGLISFFGETGIHLGTEMYEDFGFGTVIYPYLAFRNYMHVTIMVIIMALLAAIFPARRALKLNPVEAIRKI